MSAINDPQDGYELWPGQLEGTMAPPTGDIFARNREVGPENRNEQAARMAADHRRQAAHDRQCGAVPAAEYQERQAEIWEGRIESEGGAK